MALNKKSMFFSFISLFLVLILVFLFLSYQEISVFEISSDDVQKIMSLNEFVYDLDHSYIVYALDVASYNCITKMTEEIDNKNDFISDPDKFFSDCIMTGEFKNKLEEIKTLSKEYFRSDFTYELKSAKISETDQWFISSTILLEYNVTSSIASWEKKKTYESMIDIRDFYDPFLMVKAGINRKISNSLISVSDTDKVTEWNIGLFKELYEQKSYFYDAKAPSFLTRLSGGTTPSPCCGIATLVLLKTTEYSFIDYCHYSDVCNEASEHGLTVYLNVPDVYKCDTYPLTLNTYHVTLFNIPPELRIYDTTCQTP